jgi:hypothetical protein
MRTRSCPAGRPGAVRLLSTMALAVAVFATPAASQETPAPAPGTTPSRSPWYQDITFNAFLSASSSVNFNRPASRTNQLRVFDFDDGSIKVDVAELVVQRTASHAGEIGFRLDFTAGASIPRVTAASGLFRNEHGEASDFDLQQAYLSYAAPVGRGLRLDVGKFVTHMGYEVVEGYEAYNDTLSRSFLFGYAEPVTHTGLRVSYAFDDRLSAQLHLVNGWDNVRDNNRGKSIGAQLAYVPGARASLSVNYMVGPEQADNNGNMRQLLDLVGSIKPTSRLTLSANVDLGSEANVTLPASATGPVGVVKDVTWKGAAGYMRLALSDRTALIVRGERFDDRDGARTGVRQVLNEITFTPEFHPDPRLVVRGEVRRDRSDQAVFERSAGGFRDSQVTVGVNAMFIF